MNDTPIICGRCQAENEPDASFCHACGAYLAAYIKPAGADQPVIPDPATPASTDPDWWKATPTTPETPDTVGPEPSTTSPTDQPTETTAPVADSVVEQTAQQPATPQHRWEPTLEPIEVKPIDWSPTSTTTPTLSPTAPEAPIAEPPVTPPEAAHPSSEDTAQDQQSTLEAPEAPQTPSAPIPTEPEVQVQPPEPPDTSESPSTEWPEPPTFTPEPTTPPDQPEFTHPEPTPPEEPASTARPLPGRDIPPPGAPDLQAARTRVTQTLRDGTTIRNYSAPGQVNFDYTSERVRAIMRRLFLIGAALLIVSCVGSILAVTLDDAGWLAVMMFCLIPIGFFALLIALILRLTQTRRPRP